MSKVDKLALDFVEAASNALGAATKLAEDADKMQKAASEKVPATLKALKSAGLIDEHDTKTAEAQLGRHSDALDILANVIAHYEDKQASTKTAGVSLGTSDGGQPAKMTKRSNYVGRRRGYEDESEADAAFFNAIVGSN